MRKETKGICLLVFVVVTTGQVSLETVERPQEDEAESAEYQPTTFFNIQSRTGSEPAPIIPSIVQEHVSISHINRKHRVVERAQPRPRLYHPKPQRLNVDQTQEQIDSHETAKEAALSAINALSVFEKTTQQTPHHNLPTFGSDFLPIDSRPTQKASQIKQAENSISAVEEAARGDTVESDDADPANTAIGRLRFRLNELISKQQQIKPLKLIDGATSDVPSSTASGCECTTNGKSGSTLVPYSGCAKHLSNSPAFCYVSKPASCKEFSRPSADFPGASWRFCDAPPAASGGGSDEADPNTKMNHSTEDGYHKYTLAHSGVKTTLITEGNSTLTPEQGRKRSEEIISKVKEDQVIENKNLTDTLNNTKEMTEKTIAEAYSTIGDTLGSVMGAVDTALHDALHSADEETKAPKADTPATPLTYESLYKKIEDRIMNHTRHLMAPPVDKKGNVLPKVEREDPTETLYDRMMKMSDRIIGNVDRKIKAMSERMANAPPGSQSGPVSVSATTSD